MVLVIERQNGLQTEPRRNLRFVAEPLAEQPVVAETEKKSDGRVRFSGYLLRWDDIADIYDFFGEYKETFSPGSFKRTFNNNGPKGNNAIKVLRQHEQRNGTFIPGKFTDLWEDTVGPAFEAETIPTPDGEAMGVELREGVINTMSIGFDSMREEYIKDENMFDVKEAKLYEASPVYWPAYQSATIDSVRSIDHMIPTLARFLTMLEAGATLTEEQIGQLNMIRARINSVLGGSGATTPAEGNQAETIESSTATLGDSHRSQEVLARLRLAEREHGLI